MGSIREELISKLEETFQKKVIWLVYNPYKEIEKGDEVYIKWVIKKENFSNCILILSGSGGDFETALLMSYILRNNINYYACFIPSVAGSSLCYIILHSNKLIMGRNSLLTQIDPLFEHEGDQYRAIKHLDDDKIIIHNKSHDVFNYVFEKLKCLLSYKQSLLKCREVKLGYISPIIYLFMGKEYHDSGVRYHELSKLNINLELVEEDIINIGKKLIRECRRELEIEKNRLVIQTNKGGYFF